MQNKSLLDGLKWWCFKRLYHRMCLYHRMKALLWTKEEHRKWLEHRSIESFSPEDAEIEVRDEIGRSEGNPIPDYPYGIPAITWPN